MIIYKRVFFFLRIWRLLMTWHFDFELNISKIIGWIAMNIGTVIHVPLRMNYHPQLHFAFSANLQMLACYQTKLTSR